MKTDINNDACCVNCTDRTRACWDSCPAHKARLARAASKRSAINKAKEVDNFFGCLTTYSFSTIK